MYNIYPKCTEKYQQKYSVQEGMHSGDTLGIHKWLCQSWVGRSSSFCMQTHLGKSEDDIYDDYDVNGDNCKMMED